MKLFNSTKKKVVAGATAVALVSGAGFGFAATDMGTQLKEWYEGKFNVAVEDALADSEQYGKDQLPGLKDEYDGIKDGAVADINKKRDSETERAAGAIDKAKESRVLDLVQAREELMAAAGLKFNDIYQDAWAEVGHLAEEGERYATNELTGLTSETGADAVVHVNDKLDKAKDDAVADLEKALEDAKTKLEADLDRRSDLLTKNLNKEIDYAISDLRKNVNKTVKKLVQEQETIIADAAQTKEQEAIDALDEVAAGADK